MNTENCSWTWTTIDGVNGYKVQSKMPGYTDNWIFLPAAGFRCNDSLCSAVFHGLYWSSSLRKGAPNCACSIYIYSGYFGCLYNYRYYGKSVRPVSE